MWRRRARRVAAYIDQSVPNLSSIVLFVESGGRTMLLTGDGRGDDTLAGLEAADLLTPGEALRVDLLKVPHHGSDRNVEADYFERIVADHYVISGDGRHDNPSQEMLRMLIDSQGDREVRHPPHLPDRCQGLPRSGTRGNRSQVRGECAPTGRPLDRRGPGGGKPALTGAQRAKGDEYRESQSRSNRACNLSTT